MKYLLLLFLFVVSTTNLQAQFEGKIVYKNKYTSKIFTVPDQQLTTMLGSETEYFIKGGSYKTVTNGSFLQWQLYVNKDNKLYNKFSLAETLMWNDCSTNPNEVISRDKKKSTKDPGLRM